MKIDKELLIMRDIVIAYVSNNHLPPERIEDFIRKIYWAVVEGRQNHASAPNKIVPSNDHRRPTPAAIHQSIKDDGIVSFIDGRLYKTLSRHLTAHGLTPDAYRERFGLDKNYPMVAPSYSERRSTIAKRTGLGRPGFIAELRSKSKY